MFNCTGGDREKPPVNFPSPYIIKFGYLVVLLYSKNYPKSRTIKDLKKNYFGYRLTKIELSKAVSSGVLEVNDCLVRALLVDSEGREMTMTLELHGERQLVQLGPSKIINNLPDYKEFEPLQEYCLDESVDFSFEDVLGFVVNYSSDEKTATLYKQLKEEVENQK